MSVTRGRIVDYTDGDTRVWPAIVVSVDEAQGTVTLFVIYDSETDFIYRCQKSKYNAGHVESKHQWQWPVREG